MFRRTLSSIFGQFDAGVELEMNFVDPLANVNSRPSGRSSQDTGRGVVVLAGYTLMHTCCARWLLKYCSILLTPTNDFKLGHYPPSELVACSTPSV